MVVAWPQDVIVFDNSSAVERDRYDVVRLLKDNDGIPKQEKDRVDNSKLLLKALSGNGLTELLVNSGADVNAVDDEGVTTFIHANKQREGISLLKFLLKKGADYKKTDFDGKNVLCYAKNVYNNSGVVKFLESLYLGE